MPPPSAEATDLYLEQSPAAPAKSHSRLATSLHFLSDGMIFGTWATLIPSFKSKFALDEGQLSIALLGIAAGAILSMPLAGRSVARYGSRANLRLFGPLFCIALILLVLTPTFPLFIAAAVLFGAAKGAFNVSVNSQAIAVENALRKPIIPTFHALWSLGGMLAAFAVGAALKAGLAPLPIVLWITAFLAILIFAFAPHLLTGDATPPVSEKSRFQLPDSKLLRIGIITFMALFAEGVMMDWSVVYTRTVTGAAPWLAPLAYGVFSGCMATGRVFGSTLISKLGSSTVLKLGGVLVTLGLILVVGIHLWPATFFGLALIGFGLANLVPILFGAGGRAHEGGAGNGIAVVSIMGYFGFLIGPPLIGSISRSAGLPGSFTIVIAFALFIALFGNRFLGKISTISRS